VKYLTSAYLKSLMGFKASERDGRLDMSVSLGLCICHLTPARVL